MLDEVEEEERLAVGVGRCGEKNVESDEVLVGQGEEEVRKGLAAAVEEHFAVKMGEEVAEEVAEVLAEVVAEEALAVDVVEVLRVLRAYGEAEKREPEFAHVGPLRASTPV